MVFATFGLVRFPFCMVFETFWHFNLSFAWYLLHFGTSNIHVGFLRVSFGFHVGFHLSLHLGFMQGFPVRISKRSCGFLWGFFRVSFRASFGFHLGLLSGFI